MFVTAETKTYAAPIIVLHWLMALLIVGLYAVGLSIDLFDKPLRPPIVASNSSELATSSRTAPSISPWTLRCDPLARVASHSSYFYS